MRMTSEKYHGIPREEIQWFPTIDHERCEACGICVEFCHRRVFSREDERVIVSNPFKCVVGCTGCESKCESKAISFPSMRQLAEHLRSLRAKHSD